MGAQPTDGNTLPQFHRDFLTSGEPVSRIGTGAIGGKARGLLFGRDVLRSAFGSGDDLELTLGVPTLAVLATDVFDAFMERNGLHEVAQSDLPDDRLALQFQQAALPTEIVGDLRILAEGIHAPLAVRSSSLLEDELRRPFAGVYETKMTPNHHPDPSVRFHRLVEAVKFVYASTYFRSAKDYRLATGHGPGDEKMGVIVQEVLGTGHGDRFYPEVSGVARSFSFYPMSGARREDGVVNLALGLGKTIVDGGLSYAYCPARPKAPPPFASPQDLMANSQRDFWAVNIGKPPPYDPISETEYLVRVGLDEAEYDDVLRHVASTYVAASDRLTPGVGTPGPRALTFAPLLVLGEFGFNDVVRRIVAACRDAVGFDVEVEFAVALPRTPDARPRLGFLQVRPVVVSDAVVDLREDELASAAVLLRSDRVMGHGVVEGIRDVVYVRPETFETKHTRAIAQELGPLNRHLMEDGRPYLLIGFGRWGSQDPWLGIPVDWGQISGARAIVEATRPDLWVDASQGSHFFHNITSFEVSYFSVSHEAEPGIDWEWLNRQPIVSESDFVRHVRLDAPLVVKVDGRSGRGAVWRAP